MMRIAVTGVGGFVGRNLAPALLANGHEVRGLIHTGSERPTGMGELEVVTGDVRSLDSMRSLLRDSDVLIHLAASFVPTDDVGRTIRYGTKNAVSAAKDAGVQRIIFVSCLGAEAASSSPFYVAKWKAEQLVRGSELPFVILRPSLVLGRRDGITRPLADIIRTLPVIPVPGRGENRHQPIDVEDVARCLTLAVSSEDVVNESVSVGGPLFVTYRQLIDLIQGELGLSKPKVLLPPAWLAKIASVFPRGGSALFQGPRLAQWQQGVVASPGVVHRTFHFDARSIVAGLPDYLA